MMKSKLLKILKELIPYVIILVVVVLIRTYLITPVMVSGDSMLPTLKNGEVMILSKTAKFNRFDIVVAKLNRNGRNEEIIKRIIAMPGETISCENGTIYVNGKKQEEEYSQGTTEDFEKVELGENEYFLMGDNRENSADSRIFGPFTEEELRGETVFVLFPFNKFGKTR